MPDLKTPIQITINGQSRSFEPPLLLETCLKELGINLPHLAIAVNDEIIPRSERPIKELKNGDTLEVIRAVAGG